MKHPQKFMDAMSEGRSPAWGAWIETIMHPFSVGAWDVAPLRGGRGLKLARRYRMPG